VADRVTAQKLAVLRMPDQPIDLNATRLEHLVAGYHADDLSFGHCLLTRLTGGLAAATFA
jgi:hypothetical protein